MSEELLLTTYMAHLLALIALDRHVSSTAIIVEQVWLARIAACQALRPSDPVT